MMVKIGLLMSGQGSEAVGWGMIYIKIIPFTTTRLTKRVS